MEPHFLFLESSCRYCGSIYILFTPAETFDIDLSSLGEDISRAVECETCEQRGTASSAVPLQADSSTSLAAGDLSDEEDFEFITTEDL